MLLNSGLEHKGKGLARPVWGKAFEAEKTYGIVAIFPSVQFSLKSLIGEVLLEYLQDPVYRWKWWQLGEHVCHAVLAHIQVFWVDVQVLLSRVLL